MKKIFLLVGLFTLGLASPSFAADCDGAAISGMVVGGAAGACYYAKVNSDGSLPVTTTPSATPGHVILDSGTLTTLTNAAQITPAQRTIVALDVSTVTTGGTAVTALATGHRTAGGFLYNPIGATINLCINEQTTASGTTSAGGLTCIQPGQSYNLTPAAGAVSVVTSDSAHPFSGQGLN